MLLSALIALSLQTEPGVTVRVPDDPCTEGELAALEVEIVNPGPDWLVLEAVEIDGEPEPLRFRSPREGTLSYDARADVYLLAPAEGAWTDPVFTTGLLRPGESSDLGLRVRAWSGTGRGRVAYLSIPEGMARDFVFFPVREGAAVRFQRLPEGSREPPAPYRTVLAVPGREIAAARTVGFTWARTCAFRRPAREEAVTQAGLAGSPVAVSFFETHGSWVVRGPNGIALVHPARVVRLPSADPLVLEWIDRAPDRQVTVEMDGAAVAAAQGVLGVSLQRGEPRLVLSAVDAARLALELGSRGFRLDLDTRLDERLVRISAPR